MEKVRHSLTRLSKGHWRLILGRPSGIVHWPYKVAKYFFFCVIHTSSFPNLEIRQNLVLIPKQNEFLPSKERHLLLHFRLDWHQIWPRGKQSQLLVRWLSRQHGGCRCHQWQLERQQRHHLLHLVGGYAPSTRLQQCKKVHLPALISSSDDCCVASC